MGVELFNYDNVGFKIAKNAGNIAVQLKHTFGQFAFNGGPQRASLDNRGLCRSAKIKRGVTGYVQPGVYAQNTICCWSRRHDSSITSAQGR